LKNTFHNICIYLRSPPLQVLIVLPLSFLVPSSPVMDHRAYLSIGTYVRAARPLLDKLGVKTIMLFSDSSTAIDEALK